MCSDTISGFGSSLPYSALAVSYGTEEARKELLDTVASAIKQIGTSLAALGEAYELLDEAAADRLERELFAPVQAAYGRAQRTHASFASRVGMRGRTFAPAPAPAASIGVPGLVDRAIEAADGADHTLAELQDSMRPVEVGDPELRAGLAEVRTMLGEVHRKGRALERVIGR